MEFLQSIADSSNFPILTAFILGLMTAISPCPLATNITAVAYISKNIQNKRKVFLNGVIYTLGRTVTYLGLAVILYFGAAQFQIARFVQTNGEKYLGPLLIIIGILMLDLIKIRFPGLGNISQKFQKGEKNNSWLMTLLMGVVFALAFCPYSGVLYFGMLIPMTLASTSGLILPVAFAIATGLPVLILAWLIAFSLSNVGKFYDNIKKFEFWVRRIVAVIFIGVGIYFTIIFFIL